MFVSFLLPAEILKLRQSSKNDKKTRKEANAKIEELQKSMALKHQTELDDFQKMSSLTQVF